MELLEDELLIHDLTVSGPALVAAHSCTNRGMDLEQSVRRMLDVGGAVLDHGATQATVDSVRSEVDRLLDAVASATAESLPQAFETQIQALSEVLGERFDPDRRNSIHAQLVDVFNKATKDQRHDFVKALLDDQGPLGHLKSELAGKVGVMLTRQDELLKEVVSLNERLLASETLNAEKERGTAKGTDYESIVGTIVDWTFEPYEDTVMDVGTELGADGNKAGDHLVMLNPDSTRGHDLRVVVESKCRALGIRAALAELDRAMSNREAETGIMVFANPADAPLKGRAFRAFPGNRIIVVFDRENPDRLPLELAGHLGRNMALGTLAKGGDGIDPSDISDHVERLTEIVDEAKCIKRGANAARKGISQVDAGYEKLRSDALSVISEISTALT